MGTDRCKSLQAARLRQRAEAALQRETQHILDIPPEELPTLVHELQTYQIELEIQNEELRTAQEELTKSRDRYSDLYDFAPVGYLTVSDKGLILQANLTAAQMLGVERSRLIKERLSTFVVDDDQDIYFLHRRQLLETRERQRCELRMRKSDDDPFWAKMESTLTEAPDAGGLEVRAVLSDITDRKWAEEELKRAHAMNQMARKLQEREAGLLKATALLEERNKDLETLLYVTSHDLREPLRTLQNFSRLVNDRYADKLDEKGQDFLRRIVRGADRLDLLVEDVLTLSRAQRLVKPNQWLEARTIVDDALGRLQSKIRQSGAEVRVADELPRLYVDQMWATQAVYNLVANALKFTREGQPPEVEIDAYQPTEDGGSTGIVVRDRGPGVDPQYQERIFELFKRAADREVEGTGAGLAIVRQIARRHDGNVWVEGRQGGGSEFIITFGVSKERQDDPGEKRTDRDLVGGRQR